MKNARGFTLLEVLIALLVFGLIATTAAEVGSQYISSYERVRDKTLAGWLADNRINELRLQEDLPGLSEDSSDRNYGTYRWQVTTVVQGTAEPSMRRVEVTVARYISGRTEPAPIHTLSAFLGEQ
ncbi:MAG: type II secretion system minor pseudopilin GspI [Marinobacter sp.]